jgi:predicted pyridoxine 5'-phosphate oxidase superfamily flavin-nucleotide-binding protein
MNRTDFHEGERSVQVRAGETGIADRNIAIRSDTVIGGARAFVGRQFMVAVGSVDATGRVWASLLFGKPGFVQTGDGHAISIAMPPAARDPVDPVWKNLAPGNDVGLLFIELGTRRRYRVNGTVSGVDEHGVRVDVREAYPNCPKYIQRRELLALGDATTQGQAAFGTVLGGSAADIVRRADTLFVASRHPESGADVSHRGGDAGFVHVVDDTTLRIPDYVGNSLFNTLGNWQVDAHAGLCFPDFATGRLLQLTGTAAVRWNQDDPADETGGTHRYWDFTVESWVLRDAMQHARWEYLDASPFNPRQIVRHHRRESP